MQRTMQHETMATLLLIENSQTVLSLWPDLRDRCLQLLIAEFANKSSATQNASFFTLESMPTRNEGQPRDNDTVQRGLLEISFNSDPKNKLSFGGIWSGVDFLASVYRGQPAARHLIIVAATSPSEDGYEKYDNGPSWHTLAQKLVQADIQCHLIISAKQDLTSLVNLFDETLRLQNAVEESPSFPIDPQKLLFRVSAKPNTHNLYSSPVPHNTTSLHRVLPRRNNSFPSDPYAMSLRSEDDFSPSDNANANPPSLVSQLQQVHGLTKKKVYGAKPVRKPFFKEERVRKDATVIASLSAPMVATGGRALSRTRADRALRVSQTGSPTEPYSRRPRLPRRDSRLSSPETDVSASPTSYHIPTSMSPVSPIPVTNVYPQVAPAPQLQQAEPSWLQMQYPPVIPPLSEPPTLTGYPSTPAIASSTTSSDVNYSILAATAPPTATTVSQLSSPTIPCATSQSEPKPVTQTPTVPVGTEAPATSSRPSSRRMTCPEDEEPFTFDESYVAATATLFKNEVLPAYPYLTPLLDDTVTPPYSQINTPRQTFYIMQDNSVPPSPTSVYSHDSYSHSSYQEDLRILHHPLSLSYPAPGTADTPPLDYAASYSSGSASSLTSSLTGWAG